MLFVSTAIFLEMFQNERISVLSRCLLVSLMCANLGLGVVAGWCFPFCVRSRVACTVTNTIALCTGLLGSHMHSPFPTSLLSLLQCLPFLADPTFGPLAAFGLNQCLFYLPIVQTLIGFHSRLFPQLCLS